LTDSTIFGGYDLPGTILSRRCREDWNSRSVEANFAFPDGRILVGSGGFSSAPAELIGITDDRDRLVALSEERFGPTDDLFLNATSSPQPADASALDENLDLWREPSS
jgi:hypothetical protein